jgi:hypothetical protein
MLSVFTIDCMYVLYLRNFTQYRTFLNLKLNQEECQVHIPVQKYSIFIIRLFENLMYLDSSVVDPNPKESINFNRVRIILRKKFRFGSRHLIFFLNCEKSQLKHLKKYKKTFLFFYCKAFFCRKGSRACWRNMISARK